MYYVRMTDRFMSGWGVAKALTNVMVVECPDYSSAQNVYRHALTRNEMCRMKICSTKPKPRPGILYTWKQYEDLGPIWKGQA